MVTEQSRTGVSSCHLSRAERACPKRRSDLIVRVVDGETVILDRQKELVHQLNQTASYIWQQCDGTATAETIAARFAEAFAIDAETAAKDTAAIIQQLCQLQLLE
ncbi:MAG: PqqD family protein [Candidatus Binatia bacterium]|nr:PqqD family protein [Candidatus Binatia bacterium]